ncbi:MULTISPECIES: outer membrane beta-barrel protein [unclassified Imperialibacter]|uniref:outer membrane beta-barrel protein n=1 Tax=unclassified Imperialibacter TaxID=2629706 RepID=UPI001251F9E9|nr:MULTISPECIES: outer membrane beta-barrel protein [unclassified Imperialibacter]CAD5265551.1 conserved exported hypothetical protein [Imperialibacter sp. 89]CAD5270378.1 conserved exported hypothetical protein [Imperialibacter sp. 75]VVT10019.1 conserved exported hypothetical protein [Imperialibacter sp. EC-SDR9]
MKNILKIISLIAMSQFFFTDLHAQGYTSIQYHLGIPVGDFKDYIENSSYSGMAIDYNFKVSPSFAIGAGIGWNAFYERKPYATYEDGTASLSGIQYRYSNVMPVHLTGQYFFLKESNWQPYASFGVGTLFSNRTTDMGLYRWNEDAWRFSLKPEAGVTYSPWHFAGLKASVKYNQVFKKPDTDEGHSFWTVGLGVVFIK